METEQERVGELEYAQSETVARALLEACSSQHPLQPPALSRAFTFPCIRKPIEKWRKGKTTFDQMAGDGNRAANTKLN